MSFGRQESKSQTLLKWRLATENSSDGPMTQKHSQMKIKHMRLVTDLTEDVESDINIPQITMLKSSQITN